MVRRMMITMVIMVWDKDFNITHADYGDEEDQDNDKDEETG